MTVKVREATAAGGRGGPPYFSCAATASGTRSNCVCLALLCGAHQLDENKPESENCKARRKSGEGHYNCGNTGTALGARNSRGGLKHQPAAAMPIQRQSAVTMWDAFRPAEHGGSRSACVNSQYSAHRFDESKKETRGQQRPAQVWGKSECGSAPIGMLKAIAMKSRWMVVGFCSTDEHSLSGSPLQCTRTHMLRSALP